MSVARGGRFLRHVLPVLAYAAGIFAVSHMSKPPGPPLEHGLDKVAHFAAYLGLGALALRALWAYGRGHAVRWAVLGCALYAVSDEVHQRFVPGRSADVRDWVADALGASAGATLAAARARRREARATWVAPALRGR